ncbi:MAG: ubiquinol-cytochrome c reductase iron-sulfur subunit [Deltaproteobacteria bacterium]|nr:ubiquinol-cytochrome c reductase iron-sulfur subunit [Deltaproteobacteria bacterium]MCL5277347.1 ubiquinol-cytochrome c reductase iron-sulfur subunit [Deltaproteobacteria bacterium]
MVNGAGGTADAGDKKFITRRRFILGTIVIAVIGAFGSLLSMLKLLSPSKKGSGYVSTIAPGDVLVYASGSNIGTEIKAGSLNLGDAELVYPKGKSSNPANLVQLIKLAESDFKEPTDSKLTDKGFIAYSAICTHLGCTVSWVKNQTSPDASYTECFCHNSIFNPARGELVEGGPAPIPLAQIGVKVTDDDTIVFTGDFMGPIGPQV